ncbi:MAG TPA: DMT family transporter [Candidatus Bathyarchaeia archaeon]|nr:DMT family transporter [Candidatus Bathyarchaeia archaeon]
MVSDNVIAVLLAIAANSIYNIGLIFKRKGACTLPDIDEQSAWQNIKNFARCKTWFFGFSLTIIQWFPLMYALKIGSLSLIAPTMGIGFIVLILFSWLYLKEPIRLIEIIGITIVMGAITTLYIVAPIESGNYNLEEISDYFREASAIGFLCAFIAIIALLRIATHKRKYPQVGALLATSSGLSYAIATIFAKGAVGSLTFATISDFLKNSLSAWQWWIYLALMCLGYLVAFTSQQMSLQKGKALVVSPTIDISRLFMQIMAGIFVFNEWHIIWPTLEPWQKALKILSIIFIIVGVALLSIFKAQKEEHEEELAKKHDETLAELTIEKKEESLPIKTTSE